MKNTKQAENFPTLADHDRYRELFSFFRSVDEPGDHFDKQVELTALWERFRADGYGVDPLPW